jgi:hypothetical protein
MLDLPRLLVLRKSNNGWKITAIMAYPPADFVKLE